MRKIHLLFLLLVIATIIVIATACGEEDLEHADVRQVKRNELLIDNNMELLMKSKTVAQSSVPFTFAVEFIPDETSLKKILIVYCPIIIWGNLIKK